MRRLLTSSPYLLPVALGAASFPLRLLACSGSNGDAGANVDAAASSSSASVTSRGASSSANVEDAGTDANAPSYDSSLADAQRSTTGDAMVDHDSSSLSDAMDGGWVLSWSDEFDGPDGSAVDRTKWKHDVGGTGSGNSELEYYTSGTENAVVAGGNLVITATPQGASKYSCWYGACQYTSARLTTQGLFSQAYGRFEARVQMPSGAGLWPAVWMLGDDIDDAGWPACGEIDFMETIGSDIHRNHGSLHMPNGYGPTGTYALPDGGSFADGFHVFAVEWEPGTIRFYVDDVLYETQTQTSVPAGDTWEFAKPFFLLVNVAVGGNWPGSPDASASFPQTMKVDWIRVYRHSGATP